MENLAFESKNAADPIGEPNRPVAPVEYVPSERALAIWEMITGIFETCSKAGFATGWVASKTAKNKKWEVEVLADGQVVGRQLADIYLEPLAKSGMGDGRHGFRIKLPDALLDGREHVIEVREAASGILLPGSPRIFSQSGEAPSSQGETISGGVDGSADSRERIVEVLRKAISELPRTLPPSSEASHGKPEVIIGSVDGCEDFILWGWLASPTLPGKRLEVEVLADGQPIARVVANLFRPDLMQAGLADGNHSFEIRLPEALFDGKEHKIEVREAVSQFQLPGSPKTYRAAAPRQKYERYLPFATERIAAGRHGKLRLAAKEVWFTISEKASGNEHLSPDELGAILGAGKQRLDGINFTGGEPMLHPNFSEVINICREVQPDAKIAGHSSGTISVQGRYREAITKIDTLRISIVGATKETYEKIRIGADFDKFLVNAWDIAALRREAGYPLEIGFVFTACALNLHELTGVVELAKVLGMGYVEAGPLEMHDAMPTIGQWPLDTMDAALRTRLVDEARTRAAELGVQFVPAYGLYPDPATAQADYDHHVRMCQYPYDYAPGFVRHSGGIAVVPCRYLSKEAREKIPQRYGFGNAGSETLEEVYNSVAYWQFREDLLLGKTRDLCGRCVASRDFAPYLGKLL